jgi:hypothetical protein
MLHVVLTAGAACEPLLPEAASVGVGLGAGWVGSVATGELTGAVGAVGDDLLGVWPKVRAGECFFVTLRRRVTWRAACLSWRVLGRLVWP